MIATLFIILVLIIVIAWTNFLYWKKQYKQEHYDDVSEKATNQTHWARSAWNRVKIFSNRKKIKSLESKIKKLEKKLDKLQD